MIEKTGQILFRDNGNIRFRQIEILDASLVERKDKKVVKGWRHFFRLQFFFKGNEKIDPGPYTLSHERDILYDPFGILTAEEKPDMDTSMGMFNRKGIKEVAESKCYQHEHEKPRGTMLDKVTWALIIIAVLWAVAIFIGWAM